jgi:hypothetical protein
MEGDEGDEGGDSMEAGYLYASIHSLAGLFQSDK